VIGRLIEQQRREPLGTQRGVAVTLAGCDDRSLHQDVPLAGERLRLGDPGSNRQLLEEVADPGEVGRRRAMQRMVLVGMLEHHVDKRAALEVRRPEPLVEDVEDRQ
jgi:hypothetical protein